MDTTLKLTSALSQLLHRRINEKLGGRSCKFTRDIVEEDGRILAKVAVKNHQFIASMEFELLRKDRATTKQDWFCKVIY